jgi:hypothetical protein
MKAKNRLMLASTVLAVVVANGMPALAAMFGALSWSEVVDNLPVFNLVFVIPAVPAALLSAWIQAKDPDLTDGLLALQAAGLVLLTLVAYFVATLVWLPLVERLSAHVLPATWRMPHLPGDSATVLFQTLLIGFMALLPGWLSAVVAVRWAKVVRPATA